MVNKIQTSSTENYKVRLIIIEFAVRQLQRRVSAGRLYIGNSPYSGLLQKSAHYSVDINTRGLVLFQFCG